MEIAFQSKSDSDLLQCWAQGSSEAGDALIERHLPLIHRFFRNKVTSELEDLVQETLLCCLEARADFRGQASFKTFVLAIARRRLFRHYARKKGRDLDFGVSSICDLGTSPTSAIARNEEQRLLLNSLRQIPLDAQLVLELVYWENMDVVEIAQVLDVPLNTAYSRLRRARIALREKLEELSPECAEAALATVRSW
jgi:RNA polymerase sigma-70 factor (ECF subfamily)